MSTAAIPVDLSSADSASKLLPELTRVAPSVRSRHQAQIVVRRRPSPLQGRSLEKLGHSIEYLVDSRLFITSALDNRAEHEAVQILMGASRAIFSECAEIVPLRRQFSRWMEQRLPWSA